MPAVWEHCYDSVLAGADPIHYVTPGTAWDAMLRHLARETPIHLITDEQAYKDVDFNAMCPAAMTLPMPNGPCVAVALPEENVLTVQPNGVCKD